MGGGGIIDPSVPESQHKYITNGGGGTATGSRHIFPSMLFPAPSLSPPFSTFSVYKITCGFDYRQCSRAFVSSGTVNVSSLQLNRGLLVAVPTSSL